MEVKSPIDIAILINIIAQAKTFNTRHTTIVFSEYTNYRSLAGSAYNIKQIVMNGMTPKTYLGNLSNYLYENVNIEHTDLFNFIQNCRYREKHGDYMFVCYS